MGDFEFDYRMPARPGWLRGRPTGNPRQAFWMRFRDGRPADQLALPLLVDAAAPAALELGIASTTVELTAYLRARPAPGWLACRTWTKAGTLVAQSRQLALVLG